MKRITIIIGFLLLLLAIRAIEDDNKSVITSKAATFTSTSSGLPKTGDLTQVCASPVRLANYRTDRNWDIMVLLSHTALPLQQYSLGCAVHREGLTFTAAHLSLIYPHHNFW